MLRPRLVTYMTRKTEYTISLTYYTNVRPARPDNDNTVAHLQANTVCASCMCVCVYTRVYDVYANNQVGVMFTLCPADVSDVQHTIAIQRPI